MAKRQRVLTRDEFLRKGNAKPGTPTVADLRNRRDPDWLLRHITDLALLFEMDIVDPIEPLWNESRELRAEYIDVANQAVALARRGEWKNASVFIFQAGELLADGNLAVLVRIGRNAKNAHAKKATTRKAKTEPQRNKMRRRVAELIDAHPGEKITRIYQEVADEYDTDPRTVSNAWRTRQEK